MSDSYQAIYDAVRSRIGGGDIGQAVETALREAFGMADHHMRCVAQSYEATAYDGDFLQPHDQPTHWMHLPAHPTEPSKPVQAEAPIGAMRKAPEAGTDYWRLMPTGGWLHTWTGDQEDHAYLRNGLAFATREALAYAQSGGV